jgi:plasmid stabilization system protein ParE
VARLEIKAMAKSDLADILAYSVEQFGQDVAEAYVRGFTRRSTS